MEPQSLMIFVLMIVGLLIGIFSGYYLYVVLGGLGLFFGLLFWGGDVINLIAINAFTTMKNYTMIAVPLFLFMGYMLERSGVADKLFHSISINLGKFNGGLAVSALIISILFAASTGVVGATVVTMGMLFLPAMLKRGYDVKLASGVIASGGTLGILIPPSIMLVVYGPLAQISVGQLFYAVLIPGLLLGISYIVYVILRTYMNPSLAPALSEEELKSYSVKDRLLGLLHILPVLFIVLSVLGTIWFGIAPPTEAAAIGAFAAMLLALVYRKLNLQVLKETVYQTMLTTGMVFGILFLASFFVSVFMRLGGGEVVEHAFSLIPFGKWGVLVVMLLIVFILGLIMDWIASLLIIVPIFTPIANSFGFDPLWFAALICVMYQTSFLTPPFAPSIFYLRGVAPADVKTVDIIKGVWPFVGIQLLVLVLCIIFPEIILWLPEKMVAIN